MAEKMFAHQICQRGLHDVVRVTSAGTAGWHVGKCADERANRVLREHGYPTDHRAAQVGIDHIERRPGGRAGAATTCGCSSNWASTPTGSGCCGPSTPDPALMSSTSTTPTTATTTTSKRSLPPSKLRCPGLHNWVDERLAPGRARLMRRLAFLLRPGWVALAVVVIAFTYLCFSVLAPWQLGKNTKTSRENNQIQQSLTTAPVPLKTLLPQQDSSAPDAQWRRVTATGHYLPDKQLLARLRVADGKPGAGGADPVRRRRRPNRFGRPRLCAARAGFAATADSRRRRARR